MLMFTKALYEKVNVVNTKVQIGENSSMIRINKRQGLIMGEIQAQHINTYLDALRAYPPEREALITEKERYTFGELIESAERVREYKKEIEEKQGKRHIHWIQEPTIARQLIQFLAYGDGNTHSSLPSHFLMRCQGKLEWGYRSRAPES